jgi:hypothetical protein
MTLARLLPVACCLIPVLFACRQPDPPAIAAPWSDTYDRNEVGGDYLATGDTYQISGGHLTVSNGYNHPLWLRKKLPRDAVIELDCGSGSPQGDIKVEAWADGESYDKDKGSYMSSGYVFIFGGWRNDRSIIARMDEHAPTVPTRNAPKVEPNRSYHWKIVRKGNRVDWFVDDMETPFLTYDDPQPLEGAGHEYFGFNDWETPIWFDNLTIKPAP